MAKLKKCKKTKILKRVGGEGEGEGEGEGVVRSIFDVTEFGNVPQHLKMSGLTRI
jgi:hypothetical protein